MSRDLEICPKCETPDVPWGGCSCDDMTPEEWEALDNKKAERALKFSPENWHNGDHLPTVRRILKELDRRGSTAHDVAGCCQVIQDLLPDEEES